MLLHVLVFGEGDITVAEVCDTILKEEYDSSKNWLKNTLFQNIHYYSPLVKEFYFNGPLLEIMKEVIGKE